MKTKNSIFGKWYQRWLKRRMPPQKERTLNQRSIFIFPSRFGFVYLFVCLFLFTLGTNYQNNLILLMSFILIGFFVTSILFSFANLSGLTLKSSQTNPVYANDIAQIPLYLSHCLNRNTLTFSYQKHHEFTLDLADVNDKVLVPFKPTQRGLINPGRVSLKSYFPLGLLKCWTHLDLDVELLVYPQPIESYVVLLQLDELSEQSANSKAEMDDFIGIKDHIPGESISRISWKHVARNQQKLVSKEFSDSEFDPKWLSLNQIRGNDNETKLSKLTFAVNYYSKQNVMFGLDLNKTRIKPGIGEAHRLTCLKALALW
jgi:uncharacterized protein (DUF58 family)